MIEWNVAKVVVVVLLAAALISLGVGFGHLMQSKNKDSEQDQRKVFRSLVKRVAFSVTALIFILVAGFSGWLN